MNTMHTLPEQATATDAVALATANASTMPPWSSNRNESTVWTERMFAQLKPATLDCARFAAGLTFSE
jgi:hypothetical protein